MSCQCGTTCETKKVQHPSPKSFANEYAGIISSAVLLLSGIVLSVIGVDFFLREEVQLAWYLAAYLPVGFPVLKEAVQSIARKDYFSEFTLMTLATFGAFYIGEYPEGVAVMLFYSLGELFQEKAVNRAKRNIEALLDVRPHTATLIENNTPIEILAQQVQPGNIVEVKAGQRVPLDGVLLNETAAFNTSALTGESMPRHIGRDEEVLAGMIATEQVVRLRVVRSYNDSALSRILEMVQHAAERKAPAELFIRRFARIYTPIVTALAVLIVLLPFCWSLADDTFYFAFHDWLYRALVFLVISCPCALVISIPLGYFGGIGAASQAGILFKGSNYLDAIARINTVVFDKTGTLTKGTFEVDSCRAVGITEERLIQIVASTERNSTHPIAKAIVNHANSTHIALLPTTQVTEIPGHGLHTQIDNTRILVGNSRLLEKYGVKSLEQWHDTACTTVLCAIGADYAGCIFLSDVLKEDACTAIENLKVLNINNIQILSGDKQAIVTKFAHKLGLSHAWGDLLPEEKMKHLETLRLDPNNRIAFVGDGINDTPVLALSHVGIAMGGLGSDAAIETADVVIQTDQPSKVATAIRIGRATKQIIKQNIALAFGVKLLVLLLGAGGLATLWEAVFADVGVALLSILNAIRIQKLFKKEN